MRSHYHHPNAEKDRQREVTHLNESAFASCKVLPVGAEANTPNVHVPPCIRVRIFEGAIRIINLLNSQ
jgi:hypothetical protein